MTLPPNSLPVENAALSGDLLTLLGQPATTCGAESQPAAPFAEMLASAGVPTSPNASVQTPAAAPFLPAMYSNRCYTTGLQPEVVGAEPVGEGVGENASLDDSAVEADEPATEDQGVLLLAYQLLAGQWVPQPPVPVEQPAKPTGDAAELDPAFLSERGGKKTDFAPEGSFPAANGQPVGKPNQAAAPAFAGTEKTPAATQTQASVATQPETPSVSANALSAAAALQAQSKTTALLDQATAAAQNPAAAASEKFAAPGSFPSVESASGVNSPKETLEKKPLVVEGKAQKGDSRQVGTPAANREYAMTFSAANKPPVLPAESLPQVVAEAGGIHQRTTQAVAETGAATAAQAPRLVKEIHAIADRISTIDRNTVEVRFDFNETSRLSVRVEYRDGTVHTTFRTDSDTLRDAIAREWQVQAAASEPRAYRVAEPTFSTNSGASSVDLSQSGLGSGHSQSRTFEQGAPAFHGFANTGRTNNQTTSETPEPSAPANRPETSLRLHTFA